MPYGGIKMAEQACTTYGYQPSEKLHEIFTKYTRTHNQAVFDAYTPEMKKARHSHIVTGLPDTYGRGRTSVTTAAWRCTASTTSSRPSRTTLPTAATAR